MKHFLMAAICLAACSVAGLAQAQPATWGGGTGFWNDDNWNFDTQTALFADEVFGRNNGVEVGTAGELTTDAVIDSGDVTYDSGAWGDFRYKNGGSLTLTGGSTFTIDSNDSDQDGVWTEWDGETLTIDNATMIRTFHGPGSEGGGAMMLFSWRSQDNQVTDVNLTNGGSFVNDGQLWFGAPGDTANGVVANMTINDGSLDLTGGDRFTLDNDGVLFLDNDLTFAYGWDGAANGGAGAPKGETYNLNFTGPGSITVDTGIIVAREQAPGDYGTSADNKVTYKQLWDQGILQANGFSGTQGVNFDSFFTATGAFDGVDYTLTSKQTVPQVPVVWGGGDGFWNDDKWTAGSQSALFADEALGRNNGMEVGSGELGTNVFINSGNVTYDAGAWGDFRFKSGGTLNITGGATLTIDSNDSDQDGVWTEFDGDALVIDGGTLVRTFHGPGSEGGGAMMLLSWRNYDGQKLNVDIKNGGSFVNDGQLWFGAPGDAANGIEVTMTIDDGTLDLTGGDRFTLDNDGVLFLDNDLTFTYGWDGTAGAPKGETYAINFIGGGQIITDTGIIVAVEQAPGDYGTSADNLVTYEDLWNLGILQANGLSGLDGATFADWFTVTGTSGSVDYTLTSKIGAGLPGDFDGDGDVDGNDFLAWQANPSVGDLATWQANFGNTGAVASVGAVPEPASLVLVLMGGVALLTTRRRG